MESKELETRPQGARRPRGARESAGARSYRPRRGNGVCCEKIGNAPAGIRGVGRRCVGSLFLLALGCRAGMPPRTQLVRVDKFRFSCFAPRQPPRPLGRAVFRHPRASGRFLPLFPGSRRAHRADGAFSLSLAPQVASHTSTVAPCVNLTASCKSTLPLYPLPPS